MPLVTFSDDMANDETRQVAGCQHQGQETFENGSLLQECGAVEAPRLGTYRSARALGMG